MKFLITGGAGFIGFSLITKIIKNLNSFEISCLDNFSRPGSKLNKSKLLEWGVSLIDINAANKKVSFLGDFDLIIHLASVASVHSGLNNDVNNLFDSNILSTRNVLELAKKTNAKLIYISSSRIYPIDKINAIDFAEASSRFILPSNIQLEGINGKGISESFELGNVRSLYGYSKLSSEFLIKEYNYFNDVDFIINRLSNIAGPGQFGVQNQGIVAYWLGAHFNRSPLVYSGFGGKGKQVRDFLHIDDLCRLILLQIKYFNKLKNNTYNVGGGLNNSLSLNELTKLSQRVSKNVIPISENPTTSKFDIPWFVSDNSFIESKIDWKPEKDLTNIIEDSFIWVKNSKFFNV